MPTRRRRSTNGLPPWSDNPPNARWLADWQRKNGFGDAEAAKTLGISISSFRRQRGGKSPVSEQTARLALYVSLHRLDLPDHLDLVTKLMRTQSVRSKIID